MFVVVLNHVAIAQHRALPQHKARLTGRAVSSQMIKSNLRGAGRLLPMVTALRTHGLTLVLLLNALVVALAIGVSSARPLSVADRACTRDSTGRDVVRLSSVAAFAPQTS